MANSTLSSVVSQLVRASMGSSIDKTVADDDIDKHVADLILQEAKQKEAKYSALGISAYLPASIQESSVPKPNKRFLTSVIKSTDDHNRTVLKAQTLAAAEAKARKDEEDRRQRTLRAKEAADSRHRRSRREDAESSDGDWDVWRGSGHSPRSGKRKREDADTEYDDCERRSSGRRHHRRHHRHSESSKHEARELDDDARENWEGSDVESKHRRHRSSSHRHHRRHHRRSRSPRHRTREKLDDEPEGNDLESDNREHRRSSHRRRSHRSASPSHRRRHEDDKHEQQDDQRSIRCRDHPHSRSSRNRETHQQHEPSDVDDLWEAQGSEVHFEDEKTSHSEVANLLVRASRSPPPTPPSRSKNHVSRSNDSYIGTRKRSSRHISNGSDSTKTAEPSPTRSPGPSKFKPITRPKSPTPPIASGSGSSRTLVSPSPSRSPSPVINFSSKMDRYFADSYDPKLDTTPLSKKVKVPKDGLIPPEEFEGWETMLELIKVRREDKAERRRLETIYGSEGTQKKKRKKGEKVVEMAWQAVEKRRQALGEHEPTIMDIRYQRRGATREWDMGKEGPT